MNFYERLHQINYQGIIPDGMICPISKHIMNDPVVVGNNMLFDRYSLFHEFAAKDFPEEIQLQNINISRQVLGGKTCYTMKKLIENFVSYKEGKKDKETYMNDKTELLEDPLLLKRINVPVILSNGMVYDLGSIKEYSIRRPKRNSRGAIVDPLTNTEFTELDMANINNSSGGSEAFISLIKQEATYERSIFEAAEKNDLNLMQLCIDEGINLEITDTERHRDTTPLVQAILNQADDVVKLLLDNGASPNAGLNAGLGVVEPAILLAARSCKFETVKALIEHGADITVTDDEGNNIAFSIAAAGSIEATGYLMPERLNELTEHEDDNNIINVVAETSANVVAETSVEFTKIHHKKINNMIGFLLENGVDIHQKNKVGQSILMPAIITGNFELADDLIAKGFNIDEQYKAEKGLSNGGTVLLLAIEHQVPLEIIQYIIDKGADLSVTNCSGETALDIALKNGQDDVASIILDNIAPTRGMRP